MSLAETLQTSALPAIPGASANYARGSPCADAASLSLSRGLQRTCSLITHHRLCHRLRHRLRHHHHHIYGLRGRGAIRWARSSKSRPRPQPTSSVLCACIRKLRLCSLSWMRTNGCIPRFYRISSFLWEMMQVSRMSGHVHLLAVIHKQLYPRR
jgi:hypothetical protein